MNRTLQDLYYGNINPVTKSVDRSSELYGLMKIVSDSEEKMLRLLQGEEKTLFEQFSNAYIALNSKTAEERFIEGFRLGASLLWHLKPHRTNYPTPTKQSPCRAKIAHNRGAKNHKITGHKS